MFDKSGYYGDQKELISAMLRVRLSQEVQQPATSVEIEQLASTKSYSSLRVNVLDKRFVNTEIIFMKKTNDLKSNLGI